MMYFYVHLSPSSRETQRGGARFVELRVGVGVITSPPTFDRTVFVMLKRMLTLFEAVE